MERLRGDGSPHQRGPTSWGDGESCPRCGRCLWGACGGRQPPSAAAHRLGGRRVLPKRRWVSMERLRGTAAPIVAGSRHNTTQHNTTQHNTTQHNETRHNTTQHDTTRHNTTQHNTTQHNTTQHNTTQHNTTQHNTTQPETQPEYSPALPMGWVPGAKPRTTGPGHCPSGSVLTVSGARTPQCQAPSPGSPQPQVPAA